jgi:hypothetical protein
MSLVITMNQSFGFRFGIAAAFLLLPAAIFARDVVVGPGQPACQTGIVLGDNVPWPE